MSRTRASTSITILGVRVATDLAAPRPATRVHQVVATQAAGVLVLLGVVLGGLALVTAVVCAAVVLTLTWLRVRGRFAFDLLGAALRFGGRRQAPATVFELAAPGTRVTSIDLPGGPAALLVDESGLTMLLELGDPADLLAGDPRELAAPWELLPVDRRERPACRVQLLLSGVHATTGSGPVATSYRTLTEGRALAHSRAVLAIRVLRDEGWFDTELRRALTGLARGLSKRLTAHPLDRAAAIGTINHFAYADPAADVHEEWSSLRVGGLSQITFRTPPEGAAAPSADLLTRLLRLPVAAATVTLTADLPESGSVDPPLLGLALRLAAPDPATVEAAATSVRRLTALRRGDGEHLRGLTATLPLAASTDPMRAARGWHSRRPAPSIGEFGRLSLPASWTGVVVGRDRHGDPLPVRLFRPAHTRSLLVGSLRCVQLLAFRSLAVGARVLVRTRRPRDWAVFARGTAVPQGSIVLAPPGHPVEMPPGSPLSPLLIILDAGPATPPPLGHASAPTPADGPSALPAGVYPVRQRAASGDGAGRTAGPQTEGGDAGGADSPWAATVSVREVFGSGDGEIAGGADLVLSQPLRADEAALLGAALDLGDVARLLTRLRPGMVGVISRQAVRWATLSPTDVEKALIGDLSRS